MSVVISTTLEVELVSVADSELVVAYTGGELEPYAGMLSVFDTAGAVLEAVPQLKPIL